MEESHIDVHTLQMGLMFLGLPLSGAIIAAAVLIVLLFLAVTVSISFHNKKNDAENKAIANQDAKSNALVRPAIKVLFGTQTGTAERFSKALVKELHKRYNLAIPAMNLENFTDAKDLVDEKVVILCIASCGDGEPTDNSSAFYNSLIKLAASVDELEENKFRDLHIAVFGLGNKEYENYNRVAKVVHSSLKTLGCISIIDLGMGDDAACIEDDFDKWSSDLFNAFDAQPDLLGVERRTGSVAYEVPEYVVEISGESLEQPNKLPRPFQVGDGTSVHSLYNAKIAVVKELNSATSDRSCIHVEIETAGSKMKYEHGDHVAVYPENKSEIVEEVAHMLGYPLNTVFKLSMPESGSALVNLGEPFAGPIELRTALAYMADLLASPRKDSLQALAAFATDAKEAEHLKLLASNQGRTEYQEYIASRHLSLLEVMRDHPSAKPTLGAFFGAIAPRLQPRFYSISSSPKAHPSTIHVTCSVVRDVMPSGRVHDGVASGFLQRSTQQLGSEVYVYVRHSHFRLPADSSKPVIMIGPGTGLAPFRGFLQEREALKGSGANLGPAHLFFGCRNRQLDYIYQEELEAWHACGVLSDLHLAFSREGTTKDYVTHHLQRSASQIWPLIHEQSGHVYVCGDAKHMARDVNQILTQMTIDFGGLTAADAETYWKDMASSGRYLRDVW